MTKEECIKKYGEEEYLRRKAQNRERSKKYYVEHKEQCLEQGRKYRETHKEEIDAYYKAYGENNKEKLKEYKRHWYLEHKEITLERNKKYREEHPEELREYNKQYRKINGKVLYEKRKDWYKEYSKNNKEKIKKHLDKYNNTQKGRAKMLFHHYKQADEEANRGECTLTQQWIIDNIFNSKCIYCGDSDWTHLGADRIDNSKPHTPDNCVCSCKKCNIERGTKDFEEFLKQKRGL